MNWLQKIAVDAFDEEMDQLMKDEGIHNIVDNKAILNTPKKTFNKTINSGTNVGIADEYNPTETEAQYGQAV